MKRTNREAFDNFILLQSKSKAKAKQQQSKSKSKSKAKANQSPQSSDLTCKRIKDAQNQTGLIEWREIAEIVRNIN